MFDEIAGVQFGDGLAQLLLRIHYYGAVPGNRLLDRLAGDEEKTDSFAAGLHHDLISTIEEHERMIADVVDGRGVGVNDLIRENRPRIRCVAECARARKDVGKGVSRRLNLEPLAKSRRNRNVEITGIRRHAFDWTSLARELAANDAHSSAVIIGDLGNRAGRNILIARVSHLQR